MARARSPDSIEAEKLYREGMRLVDIARRIGKPEGTVRRWKSTQNWDGTGLGDGKKKQSERSGKGKANVRKKKGGQPGNKNAVGHAPSVPYGNTNALKHGGYSQIYWDTLDEEEKELISSVPQDEEEMLIQQIMLFSVRERRIMKAVNKYRDAKGGLYVSGVSRQEQKRTFKTKEDEILYEERIAERVKNGDRLPGETFGIQTSTSATVDLITRLERELTSVQSKKTKSIETLTRLRLEKQKIDGESKGNALVQAWAESVLKAREEHGDG